MIMPSAAAVATSDHAGMAADLAELEQFERWRAGRLPAETEQDLYRQRLAATVRGDIANASVLIAAMASLANAIEGRAPTATERAALSVFSPTHSVYFKTAIERLMATDLDIEDCWRLQTYMARLALAQRMSTALARAVPAALGDTGRGDLDPEIHADAWRRTCSAVLAVVDSLDAMLGSAVDGHTPHPMQRTIELLRLAGSGGTPCVDPDGRVTVPGWAERRRESRLGLNVVATAIVGGRTMAAIIRDASPSGLGLTLSAEAEMGVPVVVRLADGRELAGVVAWVAGRRAGIRLDRRLEPADIGTRRS